MAVTIRLLGPPTIETTDGRRTRPRGRKGWAVLAFLYLAEREVSRRHLADLLFDRADDPLGALRWTLADLRKAVGVDGLFRGDPISGDLGPDVIVDLDVLSKPEIDPTALSSLDGELLEGLHFDGAATFESWLVVERNRISGTIEGQLRQAVIALLAAGRSGDAVGMAAQAVARNPLDENNHELLVRCLTACGDEAGARRQVAVCQDVLRRELGIDVSPALRQAAEPDDQPSDMSVSGRAAATSMLEAGRAAMGAGAVEAGLDVLYRAVAQASETGYPDVHAHALVALGGALVHGVRGRDGEGSILLQQAISLAEKAQDNATSAAAYRELGFVEVQAGRRAAARTLLDRALTAAETDRDRAAVLAVQGMNASDRGDYAEAFHRLGSSIDLAGQAGDPRQKAWSLSILARAHLLRDERNQAERALGSCIDLVIEQRWLAFLPWPQALRAELHLRNGSVSSVGDELEAAWTLSCQLGDPCWQGMVARALGLLHAGQGDHGTARQWLDEAHRWTTSVNDRYQWVAAYVLDAKIALAHDDPSDEADLMVRRLASLAARCGMTEFVVRAHLHRWRRGDQTALDAARFLAKDLDNPALHQVLNNPSGHVLDRLIGRTQP